MSNKAKEKIEKAKEQVEFDINERKALNAMAKDYVEQKKAKNKAELEKKGEELEEKTKEKLEKAKEQVEFDINERKALNAMAKESIEQHHAQVKHQVKEKIEEIEKKRK